MDSTTVKNIIKIANFLDCNGKTPEALLLDKVAKNLINHLTKTAELDHFKSGWAWGEHASQEQKDDVSNSETIEYMVDQILESQNRERKLRAKLFYLDNGEEATATHLEDIVEFEQTTQDFWKERIQERGAEFIS